MQLNTGKKGQNQLLEDSHDYTINTLLCQHNFCQRLKAVPSNDISYYQLV